MESAHQMLKQAIITKPTVDPKVPIEIEDVKPPTTTTTNTSSIVTARQLVNQFEIIFV